MKFAGVTLDPVRDIVASWHSKPVLLRQRDPSDVEFGELERSDGDILRSVLGLSLDGCLLYTSPSPRDS